MKKTDPISQRIFQRIAEVLMIPAVKVNVKLNSKYSHATSQLKVAALLTTAVLFGVAIWGVAELEVRFESVWFLPPESYLRQW